MQFRQAHPGLGRGGDLRDLSVSEDGERKRQNDLRMYSDWTGLRLEAK